MQTTALTFQFKVLHKSTKSSARVGQIVTPHGVIDTPSFVAVGTNGTIKALDNNMVTELGLQLMFCNTYHLILQPGSSVVKQAGGLHRFIGRTLPIITDSGGFQVFSLAYGSIADELKGRGLKKREGTVLKINEEGVLFRSYRDGAQILLTPETSILAQKDLGADIIIPFDELPPYHIEREKLVESLERTHRWEERSLNCHLQNPNNQAMYAVIHGGIDNELREKSCRHLSKLAFDGFAIGGSVGENRQEMFELLQNLMPLLPSDRPNHLLGIGDMPSLEMAIPMGVDTFDSSYPTRCARHAILLTHKGNLNVTKRIYQDAFVPIERDCTCYTCQNYTLAYLNHLFKASEIAALTLATIHNLHFMVQLMVSYRRRICENII